MKIFIFDDVEELTGNWHSNGGLVVIAQDKEHAKALIEKKPKIKLTEEEWGKVHEYVVAEEYEPRIYLFPNAGCC